MKLMHNPPHPGLALHDDVLPAFKLGVTYSKDTNQTGGDIRLSALTPALAPQGRTRNTV